MAKTENNHLNRHDDFQTILITVNFLLRIFDNTNFI